MKKEAKYLKDKIKRETALEVVGKIIKAGTLDFFNAVCINPNEKSTQTRKGMFYADVEKLNKALSEYGVEIVEKATNEIKLGE